MILRPNWRLNTGPGNFIMPVDPAFPLMQGLPCHREDSQVGIDADGHDIGGIGDGGGTGIVFGNSSEDPENIILMEGVRHARLEYYNWEHFVRQFQYAIYRTDMIRDTIGPRRVIQYANLARTFFSETGPVFFGAGWYPDNIHQYHEAALHNPGVGLPWNIREIGWAGYIETMACKVDPNRSRAWLQMFLSTCEMAAIPGTGQLSSGPNTGGGPTVPVNVQYSFHWGICAHAAICAARVLHQLTPLWVIEGMEALDACSTQAGAVMSFLYSEGGILKVAQGSGQHTDPAYGWWTTNCAALAQAYDPSWKPRAMKWFAPTGNPEQDRKFTLLYRGIA